MFASLGLLAIAALTASASTFHDCVLAGPDFPPPSSFSTSQLHARAVTEFEGLLTKKALGLLPNDTAWGVALFSSKENKTIYEHYYTPPINIGIKEVDRDSIFRIGSVSKVFSVWSFLIEAGDSYFNEPITTYVPELANLSFIYDGIQSNTLYDDINHVRWDEVNLGELASQAAGIVRDRKFGAALAITKFIAKRTNVLSN